jgi:hypothetical protein
VATDSTQEYRELRELLDTGSSGAGAATAEAAEKKQALMVFGGAAAVVLLVIIGLVAFPKADDKGKASTTPADKTGAPAGEATGNGATSTTAAPVPALVAPAGTKAVPYEVLSTKLLPGLKAGDRVDFLNGPDVVARNILVLAVGEEQDILAGFKQRVVTIAASDEETRNLLSVTAGKRSMTQASGEPAPTTPPPSG